MLARQLADPAQRAELDRGPAGAVNPAGGSGGHDHRLDSRSPGDTVDVDRLAEVIAATGAVRHVEALIRQRVAEGIDALGQAPIHDDARRALTELAVAATDRPS